MSFIKFMGDLGAYVPTLGDLAKGVLLSGSDLFTELLKVVPPSTDLSQLQQDVVDAQIAKTAKSETDYTDGTSVYYPNDLFSAGVEAYIAFFMRDPVEKTAKTLKRVALYMPPNIGVNYGATWTDVDMALTTGERDQLKADAKGIFDSPLKTSIETALGAYGKSAIKTTMQYLQTTQIGQQASVISSKTVNPMTSLMFKGTQLRQFKFDFHLMARDETESKNIQKIISIFKYGMHPEVVEKTESLVLNYPNTFDIFLLTPSSEYLFNIQRSVLVDMSVDYNGSGVASFFKGTGAPVDVRLTLQFKETELLTKSRIISGY